MHLHFIFISFFHLTTSLAFINSFNSPTVLAGALMNSYNGPRGPTERSEAMDSKDEGLEGYSVIISVELRACPSPSQGIIVFRQLALHTSKSN